ncbi:6-phosphogluconate dehydrogenase [soil metagenome]
MRRFTIIATFIVLFGLGIFFWWRFYYPFTDNGSKDGYLNKIEHKGYVFKTWEGTLMQVGLKSASPGSMQSPTFEFSVTNEGIAKQLQANSGKYFNLRYKEYFGTLPWRGHSKYIVDSILSMRDVNSGEVRPGF